MMRVLFIDNDIGAPNNFGGAGASLVGLIGELRTRGVDVGVCGVFPSARLKAYEAAGAWTIPRIDAELWRGQHQLLRKLRGGGAASKRLLRSSFREILERSGAVVVHANLFQKWDCFDLELAQGRGIKTVGHVRSMGSQVTLGARDIDSADAVLCVSDAVRTNMEALFPGGTFRKVYNPVEARNYQCDLSLLEARQQLGLDERHGLLLFSIGALEQRKGHDTAIAALSEVRRQGTEVQLVIAGGAYDGKDCAERARLGRVARDCGVLDAVHFAGHVANMATVYAAADVVLALSSDGEAFGRVPVEAAFAGKPVIGTAIGATPEIILDGTTGWLVPPMDAQAVANRIVEIFAEPGKIETVVDAAADRARTLFDTRQHADKVIQVYQTLLASSALGMSQ